MPSMTSVGVQQSSMTVEAPEMMTDEKIENLLQEAEARLRAKAGLVAANPSEPRKPISIPKLQHGFGRPTYIEENHGVAKADPNLLMAKEENKMTNGLRPLRDVQKSRIVNDQADAGDKWFNLPKTTVTPQLKRDLQLIEMRSVLDPHRHYKKNTRKGKIPTFSQVGTVIEGPTEFYSGRINRKDRSKNFVEESMKTEDNTGRFKRKYAEIQNTKTSGKKAHYKKLMQKRQKKS